MRPDVLSSHQQRILDAQVQLEAHLDGRVSLAALARQGNYSTFHFLHVFRALVGEAPGQYQRRLRIERAAHELRTTRRTIVRIAGEAGYRTHAAFTKAFRARYGLSPSAFRDAVPVARAFRPEGDLHRLRIEPVTSLRVAFIRYRGPYAEVPPVFERLREWVSSRQSQQPFFIGLAQDDPGVTPAEQVRFDCGVIVAAGVRGEGSVGIQQLPAGDYAAATHHGPFSSLEQTYGWLGGIGIPSLRRTLRKGPAVELYLTDPVRTPEAERLTDILLPLRTDGRVRTDGR